MTGNEARWRDGYWTSADGLTLHYRDYPGDPAATPVICIPGLTRNARDFAAVADRLAGGRRVIVVELRGRGMSDWSPDFATYHAAGYVGDVRALLAALDLPRFVIFGTSLGGIIAMVLGASGQSGLAGVLLNDIGPVIEEAGLERIRGYIGPARWPSWEAAARAMAETHGHAFPDFEAADWRAMAERLAIEKDGAIVGDYDPAIAILVAMPTPAPAEPWRLIEGFEAMPTLLVHGALSDILSAGTAAAMARRLPRMETVTLPRVGHPPLLTEPGVEAAIDRLLAAVDSRG
ncbi:alpha/beta fold hydrolase [Sphingomonas bacterium]|uniref:alpha/beta fold hydrolase n=1 Tax=Sphingomonas bacterium TaxID=1895847 RepID=UPI001575433D|nr:alpha/beta hydrolase [Sphingomonas bacterium]